MSIFYINCQHNVKYGCCIFLNKLFDNVKDSIWIKLVEFEDVLLTSTISNRFKNIIFNENDIIVWF